MICGRGDSLEAARFAARFDGEWGDLAVFAKEGARRLTGLSALPSSTLVFRLVLRLFPVLCVDTAVDPAELREEREDLRDGDAPFSFF